MSDTITDMRMDKEESELLSDEDLDDEALEGDTWIEELECALLADCDPATLKKICEGKRVPASLRPDYWKALLALTDSGKVKLTNEYDLENQLEIRQDCERLVEDIALNLASDSGLSEPDKLQLLSNFESTLTTYVKARPELSYIPDNGWTDILRVLYHLDLSDSLLYQMFFRIVDRYIPKDLSKRSYSNPPVQQQLASTARIEASSSKGAITADEPSHSAYQNTRSDVQPGRCHISKSNQAYHLLRLLIQYHDPELCSILDSRKVTPNLYVKDWFCSLFARSCPPKLALLIWDTHFKMADPFLIFFAAIVMVFNASDELKKSNKTQADMLQVLKSMPGQLVEDDIEDLYYLVSNHYTYSTPRSIRTYSHLLFMDTFGNTYTGNETSDERSGSPVLDLKTIQLTNKLDLSQYLCLPVVPAEIFAIDTAFLRSSPSQSPTSTPLKYFLVDCRPAEQYNAGHLNRAFHLDCSLMLREPSSFATAVQALLDIQRQVVASKSNTGGQHLCFIGSGHEEEDQYVNMVVASFLRRNQKYVSIVVGGFEAVHDYAATKGELKDSFDKYIVDHNQELCKVCCLKVPGGIEGFRTAKSNASTAYGLGGGFSSAHSLLASTTNFLRGDKSVASLTKLASNQQANLLAQSGVSMLDKFASAFVTKSSEFKDRIVETLNTSTIPAAAADLSAGYTPTTVSRSHVSSADKTSRRYMGSSTAGETRYAIDDNELVGDDTIGNSSSRFAGSDLNNSNGSTRQNDISGGPMQEVQIDIWQEETKPVAFYKCSQIKGSTKFPGYVALTSTHLLILHEIPHNKGFVAIAARRPLDMIVQITSKRRQPDLIIFRYGFSNQQAERPTSAEVSQAQDDSSKSLPTIVASDHLHIPQAFELIRLIKREIVRIMDENSRLQPVEVADKEESQLMNAESRENDDNVDATDKETHVESEVKVDEKSTAKPSTD